MVVEEKLTRWIRSIKTPHTTQAIADRFMVSKRHTINVLDNLETRGIVARLKKGNRVHWKCLL
jgi:ribosomal protein S25